MMLRPRAGRQAENGRRADPVVSTAQELALARFDELCCEQRAHAKGNALRLTQRRTEDGVMGRSLGERDQFE